MALESEKKSTVEELTATVREQHLMLLRAQDREIGLEQQLNTLRAGHNREDLVREIATLRASASYKIGRFITAPFRFIGFVWIFGVRALKSVARRIAVKLRQR